MRLLHQVLARAEGIPGMSSYRVFFYHYDNKLSPWHDIPLVDQGATIAQGELHYVVEIPKGLTLPYLVFCHAAVHTKADRILSQDHGEDGNRHG